MEEKTFLIHLLKDDFKEYRQQVIKQICKDSKADTAQFEFIASDLPSTNKRLTYSVRISESLKCNN